MQNITNIKSGKAGSFSACLGESEAAAGHMEVCFLNSNSKSGDRGPSFSENLINLTIHGRN